MMLETIFLKTRGRTKRSHSAAALVFFILFLTVLTPAAAQRPVCLDPIGNPRTVATSNAEDICYDQLGNPTTLKFSEYLSILAKLQQTITPAAPAQPGAQPIPTEDLLGQPQPVPLDPLRATPDVPPSETPDVPPSETPDVPPSETPDVPPTETPDVPPTETPDVPPTETPDVPPTNTPVTPPTNTPVTPPTNTPVTPPTNTPVTPPTSTPVTPPTNTPTATEIPAPGKPILISPNAEYTTRTQTFSWKISSDTTKYRVFWKNEWNDTGTADLPATDPACGSDSCSLTTTLPIEGKYTWNVTASNSGSKTTVSDNMEFRVNPNITTPGGILPSGYINNRRWVSFVFDDVRDGVKEYNVQIYNEDKRVVMDEKRKTSELTFANNRVTFNAYVDLPAGKYYWRVRGRSDNSLSNWSAPIEIRTTTYYQPPAPPPANNYNTLAIFSPSGTVTDASLTLSWRPIVGASSYTIKVYNSSGAEIFSSDVSSSVCSAYSCSATPGFTYPAVGSYRIYVAARSATGVNWGDGSSWVTYSTTPATVATTSPLTIRPAGSDPNQATVSETRFLSPADQGKLHVSEAAISWVDQGETVKYYDVRITDASGASLLDTTLDRQTAYCNNKNCTIVFDEIAPADGYRLTLTPKSENGTAGTATTLTFNVTDQDLPMTGLYPTDGQTTVQRPYFSWTLPTGTANAETFTYALKIKSTTNKAETIYSDLVCTDERVGCFKGGASFILTENLPAGEYTWQVQNKETNLMTEEMKFIVP